MMRLRAPLTLVITLLLLVLILVAPATAREIKGPVMIVAPTAGVSYPGGGGDDSPVPVEGDPDELTGGNLSLSDPEKRGVPSPNLWQRFLTWIQQRSPISHSSR